MAFPDQDLRLSSAPGSRSEAFPPFSQLQLGITSPGCFFRAKPECVPTIQYPCISIDSLWSGVDAAACPKMDVGCRNCICGVGEARYCLSADHLGKACRGLCQFCVNTRHGSAGHTCQSIDQETFVPCQPPQHLHIDTPATKRGTRSRRDYTM